MSKNNKQPYDSSDPKQVKSAKQKAKILDERFARGIVKICEDRDTRFVLARFFDQAGVFRDEPMLPTPDHVFEHGRNAGTRSMGLWWMQSLLLHDPEIIGKLQKDEDSPIKPDQDNND